MSDKGPSEPFDLLLDEPPYEAYPEIPVEVQGVDIESASEALSALTCPYYNGVGKCYQGCRDEPICQTNEPTEGWAWQLREACGKGSES